MKKQFGKRVYTWRGSYRLKKSALAEAKRLRAKDYVVKVVGGKGKRWEVWAVQKYSMAYHGR